MDPAEFGTFVHYVLEQTAKEVMSLGGFHQVSREQTLDIAHKYAEEYAAERFGDLDSERLTYLFRRNGLELGGFGAASDSKTIYALLVAWDAPLAVSKIDSLKQFGPSENQLFDGTAIQARYLYDLFVPKNKQVAIGALVQA